MANHADPGFSDWQLRYWREHADELARPFSDAQRRGEIPGEVDAGLLFELLVGPMVVRTVIMKQALSRDFVDQLAAHIVQLARSGSPDA